MTALRVAIVDDEDLARLRLRTLLGDLAELPTTVVGEAADAQAALALLRGTPADVVLLDVRMPGAGGANPGLQLAAALRVLPRPPAVIFVTAHADHALTAFELDAVDYLTKPVRRERLLAALQRARQRINPVTITEPAALDAPALVVSERGRLLRLPLAEVLYLKAELKYVTLRTVQREHLLSEPLSDLERSLSDLGGRFIRVHRNALVARHAIRALELRGTDDESGGEGWAVRVAPLDEWLAVSRRQVGAVRAALGQGGA